MAKEKQHVFSARTTEEGLRQLNELKARLGIGWDDLVIDTVCAHYNLDKAVMALPKKEVPAKEREEEQQSPAEATVEERPAEAGQEKAPAKKHGKKNNK